MGLAQAVRVRRGDLAARAALALALGDEHLLHRRWLRAAARVGARGLTHRADDDEKVVIRTSIGIGGVHHRGRIDGALVRATGRIIVNHCPWADRKVSHVYRHPAPPGESWKEALNRAGLT